MAYHSRGVVRVALLALMQYMGVLVCVDIPHPRTAEAPERQPHFAILSACAKRRHSPHPVRTKPSIARRAHEVIPICVQLRRHRTGGLSLAPNANEKTLKT
eukprot:5981305-Pyramimonas_sp.AAC.1